MYGTVAFYVLRLLIFYNPPLILLPQPALPVPYHIYVRAFGTTRIAVTIQTAPNGFFADNNPPQTPHPRRALERIMVPVLP